MTISDFHDMMPHTVIHRPLSSRDAYGKPTYGAATNYQARVVYRPKLLRRADGSEVMAAGHVWLSVTSLVVQTEDKITLPDGDSPPILFIEKIPDDTSGAASAHHTKVWFG